MTFEAIYEFVRSFWVLWLMLLFIGIVVWAFWPGRRKDLEAHARIPLDDDHLEK